MRVVNLSRKPFVNRRPVVRLTIAFWLLGAILLGLNITLYRDYWLGTAENRERLATADMAIEEQLEELEAQEQALSKIRLRRQNRKATFLNSLITRRTFPWSDLFDRLEEVTPNDVRLVSVNPLVKMANDTSRSSADTGSRSSTRSRTSEDSSDAVSLKLTGWAKSEEALTTFVDTLYQDPAFGAPLLQGEFIDREGREEAIRFNLETSFLIDSSKSTVQVVEEESTVDEGSKDEEEPDVAQIETQNDAVDDESDGEDYEDDDPEMSRTESEVLAARTSESPQPSSPPPPSARQVRQNAEEAEAIRQEVEAAREGAVRTAPREPQPETSTRRPLSRDQQQQLEALRARAAARSRANRTRNTPPPRQTRVTQTNPSDSSPPTSEPPIDEEDDPTDINPPASSTPRLNGISWQPPFWNDDLPPGLQPVFGWEEEVSA